MLFRWMRKREGLNLGTGDRSTISATKSSDELARELLETARDKAKELAEGEQVTVEVTEGHREVHHMELMVSLMLLAPEYGFRVGTQFDNKQTFTKV